MYQSLLSVPGALRFVAAGLLGRISTSMVPLVLINAMMADGRSYALAGAASAASAVCYAAFAPFWARGVDRWGQCRVLRWIGLANVAATVTALASMAGRAGDWPAVLVSLGAFGAFGASLPSLGAMVRARWSFLLVHNEGLLTSAFALESTMDEVSFVIGPLVAAVLCQTVGPHIGIGITCLLVALACGVLSTQSQTAPPANAVVSRRESGPLFGRKMWQSISIFALLGAMFGNIDIGVVRFAREYGHLGMSGVFLALFAGGSALSAVWFGSRRWRRTAASRLNLSLFSLSSLLLPPALVSGLLGMTVAIFLAGLALSPVIISGYEFLAQVVPAGRSTEGLTYAATAMGIGISAGTYTGGLVADSFGKHSAFAVAVGATFAASLVSKCYGGMSAPARSTSNTRRVHGT